LIPAFDGSILPLEWKEAIWDRFVTGAPRRRTPSERQCSDRKLRSRLSRALGSHPKTVAKWRKRATVIPFADQPPIGIGERHDVRN